MGTDEGVPDVEKVPASEDERDVELTRNKEESRTNV